MTQAPPAWPALSCWALPVIDSITITLRAGKHHVVVHTLDGKEACAGNVPTIDGAIAEALTLTEIVLGRALELARD